MSDSEQQYDRANVNMWVDHEQKERWEKYLADESEFQHLSQLVRQSVEREIGGNGKTVDLQGLAGLDGKFDSLQNSIDGLSSTLEDVEARLTSIERVVRDDPDLRELANQVFEVLPSKDTIDEYRALVSDAGSRPPEHVEPWVHSGMVADIANAIDANESRVAQALNKLQRDTHQVHSMERDGETRFYKEG